MTRRRIRIRLIAMLVPLIIAAAPAYGQCDTETAAPDCNANGIPDACELTGEISIVSGPLGPLDSETSQMYEIDTPPIALEDLVVTFTARGDLSDWTERVDVWLNETPLRSIFLFAIDCDPNVSQTIVISKDTYMTALESGSVAFLLVPSFAVDPGFCAQSFIDVKIDMVTLPATDENGNGVLDECEQGGGDDLCQGFEPTVYVDEQGYIVGGPLAGRRYNGVLVGTPGNDVIMGTPGNDLIVGASGDDTICGNGGNDHIAGEPQGEAKGHGKSHAQGKARGRKK